MPLFSRSPEISAILARVVENLSLTNDLSTITTIVAEAARQLAQADGATFVLRDHDKCYYADENAISPLWKGQRFPLEACISGWSMLNKQVVMIPDIYSDARVPHDAYRPTFVKSLCMVPIRSENPLGAIGIYWCETHEPTASEIKILQVLANSTAVALENLELRNSVRRSLGEEASLRDKTKELEAALYSLAHDLRSPVSAMAGFAELARIELPEETDPQVLSYLQSIFDTAQQTNTQIERMLALYQITSGKIEKQKVDLSQISRKILSGLQSQVQGRELRADIEDGIVVQADPSLIHLAVENLLSNAVKYSGKKPYTHIRVGHETAAGFETVFIRDNGDGFEPSQAHRLFRPLSRLHSSSDFQGTGLGLFSVARIIELHGGRMGAEARPQEGATFYFTLPA